MKIEVDREIEFKEFRVAIISVEGRWCHYALISLILLQFRERERERERERYAPYSTCMFFLQLHYIYIGSRPKFKIEVT